MTFEGGDYYVRYSPDLVHWTSWQRLQDNSHPSMGDRSAKYWGSVVGVPALERLEYNELLEEYSQQDVPWKSDEEAAVKWILEKDPAFFEKHIPFIGYVQVMFEQSLFQDKRRVRSLEVIIDYGMGGLHSEPKDNSIIKERYNIPWRFEAKKINS